MGIGKDPPILDEVEAYEDEMLAMPALLVALRKEPVTLQDAVNHAVETSASFVKKYQHRLIVDMPENPIWLDADFIRLSRIFSYLLNNAAKYTNNNGIIQIIVRSTYTAAIISVKDNGIGIPENMLQGIADMFSQVGSSQGEEGARLTLVRNLVEVHDGKIRVSSSGNGTGSEFVVTFPVLSIQAEPAGNDALIASQGEPSPERSLKVLIVDDNSALLQIMGLTIELLGHYAYTAYDGVSAIELARKYRPEIILMDIGLPGVNGYEICGIMKKDPLLAHTVFVAQTGWGEAEHRKRSQEAGFDFHLVKPINMHDLQQVIEKYAKKAAAPESGNRHRKPGRVLVADAG